MKGLGGRARAREGGVDGRGGESERGAREQAWVGERGEEERGATRKGRGVAGRRQGVA